jgi:DNA-binding transcriptional ArsR family regulator
MEGNVNETVTRTKAPDQPAVLTAKFFRAFGDPSRVRIMQLLLEKDRNVSELVELLGSPQGRVSSHLACLRWCGFMETYRFGKNVYYRIADQRVKQLLQLAQSLLIDNAERVAACFIVDAAESDGEEG